MHIASVCAENGVAVANGQKIELFLMLDITKAQTRLGWQPKMSAKETIALTADWCKRYKSEDVYELCAEEIRKYEI